MQDRGAIVSHGGWRTKTPICCIVGGGPAGMMAGLLFARAGVHDPRAREACRLPPRFPRRHRPPLDDGDLLTSSACSTGSSSGRTTRSTTRGAGIGGREYDDRRPSATSTRAGAVHRDDAAMGVPRFPRATRRGPIPAFALRDGAPSRRASSRRTGGSRRPLASGGERARDPRQLIIAADGRALAGARARRCCRSAISARRWTCSGSGCRRRATPDNGRSGVIAPAGCWC